VFSESMTLHTLYWTPAASLFSLTVCWRSRKWD